MVDLGRRFYKQPKALRIFKNGFSQFIGVIFLFLGDQLFRFTPEQFKFVEISWRIFLSLSVFLPNER